MAKAVAIDIYYSEDVPGVALRQTPLLIDKKYLAHQRDLITSVAKENPKTPREPPKLDQLINYIQKHPSHTKGYHQNYQNKS